MPLVRRFLDWARKGPPELFRQPEVLVDTFIACVGVAGSGQCGEEAKQIRNLVLIAACQQSHLVQHRRQQTRGTGAATESEQIDPITRLPLLHQVGVCLLDFPEHPAARQWLWQSFKKRKGKQLQTMISTMSGKHGKTSSKTEVPRRTLVTALESGSQLKNTQKAQGQGHREYDDDQTGRRLSQ
jgi:hypothetical protein